MKLTSSSVRKLSVLRIRGLVVILLFCSISSFAQPVSNYLFSPSIGTYTQVNDLVATRLTSVEGDDVISSAQNIGFSFVYEGTPYTQFKMSSNGAISLNMTGTGNLITNDFTAANATSRPIIAPLWDDLDGQATGGISRAYYELTGSSPNQILTIEWRNWEWNYSSSNPVMSFQIKLYETSNIIEFVYRQESGSVSGASASIGIGSATGSGSGSYLNITDMTTFSVSSTTNNTSIATKPANNQVFTFSPPLPCTGTPTPGIASAPSSACSNSPFILSATGATIATGITYQWMSSPAGMNTWSPVAGATATISTVTSGISINSDFHLVVTCTGTSQADSSNNVTVTVPTPYPGGTYTINSAIVTGAGNFQTFSDAMAAIGCGISGPVVLNVVAGSGPYNEQVTIPSTVGATATNTVTINGNGNTVTFNATSSALPYTLGLNGADYITVNNLIVEGTNGTYAMVCHLWDQADNNNFNNCTFTAPANGTATTQVPFSISGVVATALTTGPSGNNNVVTGCTMNSGYYSTVFYGNSTTVNTGNQLINCTLTDFYFYGAMSYYQNGIVIRGNTIERPNRTTLSTFYGIYILTGNINALVEKNKIRNPFGGNPASTSTAYGVYSSISATAGNENLYYNNLISDMNGNGTLYGMYFIPSNNVKVYHNTISLDNIGASGTTTTYGIYNSGTSNIDIINNAISITRGGTGTKYGLYYPSAAGRTSNNNNLYINAAAGTNYVGYYSTAAVGYSSLAAWQAAPGGLDAASLSVDPLFTNPSIGDYTPSSSFLDNQGAPVGITTDITGLARSATTPDIGAYEFTVPSCAGIPTPGIATGPASACSGSNFNLSLSGYSVGIGIAILWETSPSGANTWTAAPGVNNSPVYTTNITTPMDYRAVVTCSNGGGADVSNTVAVGISSFYLCYCSPMTGTTLHTTQLNYITNVTITGTTLNNTSTTVGSGGYSQFSSTVPSNTATLDQGLLYNIQVTFAFTGYFAGVWFDWNQDGFMDPGEEVTMTTSGTLATGSIVVPYTSTPGMTGMRVRHGTSALTPAQACTTTGYETEDYAVTVVLAVGCFGTPNTAVVTGPAGACQATPFTLTASGYTTGIGITFEWQSFNTTTSTWDPLPIPNNNPTYTVANQTSATDYRFVTTCINGGGISQSNTLSVLQNPATQCYCTPTYNTGGSGDIVANVQLGTLINNSAALGNPPSHYTDYTLQQPATISIPSLSQGLTSNLTLTFGTDGNQYHGVWLDFDQNGVFDTYEFFVGTPNPAGGSGTAVVPIIVPVTSSLGNIRMRIRGGDDQAVTSAQACGFSTSTNYGEAEDYLVNILPAPSCVPPGTLSATGTNANSTSLGWIENGTANQWSLEYGPAGFTPGTGTFVSITPTTGYALSGLTPNTAYQFYVRAKCSATDSSIATGPMSFSTTQIPAVPPYAQNWETGGADWTYVNGGQVNKWHVGTATANTGTGSLYISNTNGTGNVFDINVNSAVHAFRDVDLTGYTAGVPLDFNWKALGEGCCDYLRVWVVPTTYTPTAGVQTTAALSGGTQLGVNMNLQGTFVPANLTIPATFGGTIARVILEWRNDGSLGSQPPAAIDNLTIGGAPLMVKLDKISAVNVGNRNRVDWNTESEMRGDKFEIERSSDGIHYLYLATVNGKGEATTYSFWDEAPVSGVNQYRLKMTDALGEFAYSPVVKATMKGAGTFIVEAYPNPVSNVLTVKVFGSTSNNAAVSVSDATGKVVKVVSVSNNEATINMSGLAQGLYLVKYSDDNRTQTIKVNKH